MIRFHDRREAGRRLAQRLEHLKGRKDLVVLGIPRGGVVVAAEVAQALAAPLDVFITRKIGAPFNHELAIGAVASDGTVFYDHELIFQLQIPYKQVEQERERQLQEVHRRAKLYRGDHAPIPLQGRIAILVDDGVATGATTITALRALKHQNVARSILAVPVAPPQVVPLLRAECDELVVLDTPDPFLAVGYFYEDFGQTTDEEVIELLDRAQRRTQEKKT